MGAYKRQIPCPHRHNPEQVQGIEGNRLANLTLCSGAKTQLVDSSEWPDGPQLDDQDAKTVHHHL